MKRIDTLYAFIAENPHGEGIVAEIVPGVGATPFVTGSKVIRDQFLEESVKAAAKNGITVRMVTFTRTEEQIIHYQAEKK